MGIGSNRDSRLNCYLYEGPESQIHGAFEELLEVLRKTVGKRTNYREEKGKRTFEYNPEGKPGHALVILAPFLRIENIQERLLEMKLEIRESVESADLENSFSHRIQNVMENLRLRYGLRRPSK